jgi:hypothetical protein
LTTSAEPPEFADVQLQPEVFEDAYRQGVVEFYQDVDVAFGARFAPRDRTDDCGMRHSKTPQVRLMRPQSFEHPDRDFCIPRLSMGMPGKSGGETGAGVTK